MNDLLSQLLSPQPSQAGVADHSVRAHAKLSASGSYRFIACPGSIRLCEGRESPSSEYAKIGTAAHELAQLCLENGQDAIDYVDRKVEGYYIDSEWAEQLQVYLDVCRRYMDADAGWVWWIERRISLEALGPPVPMYGTADFVAFNTKTGELVVVDLKWGQGVVVKATNNPQLRYYGIGSALSLPEGMTPNSVTMIIVQPRARTAAKIKDETISYQELVNWCEQVLLPAARRTLDADAPVAAGEHCRFCPAAGICPAQAEKAMSSAMVAFVDVITPERRPVPPDIKVLTSEQLAQICLNAGIIRQFLTAAEDAAAGFIRSGVDIPGLKLVATRGRSEWADDDAALVGGILVDALGIPESEAYKPREVITLASAREVYARRAREAKQFKSLDAARAYFKDAVADMVTTPSSGTALVPVDDARPAITTTDAGSAFLSVATPQKPGSVDI